MQGSRYIVTVSSSPKSGHIVYSAVSCFGGRPWTSRPGHWCCSFWKPIFFSSQTLTYFDYDLGRRPVLGSIIFSCLVWPPEYRTACDMREIAGGQDSKRTSLTEGCSGAMIANEQRGNNKHLVRFEHALGVPTCRAPTPATQGKGRAGGVYESCAESGGYQQVVMLNCFFSVLKVAQYLPKSASQDDCCTANIAHDLASAREVRLRPALRLSPSYRKRFGIPGAKETELVDRKSCAVQFDKS